MYRMLLLLIFIGFHLTTIKVVYEDKFNYFVNFCDARFVESIYAIYKANAIYIAT